MFPPPSHPLSPFSHLAQPFPTPRLAIGAAAFEAMKAYEDKERREGKPESRKQISPYCSSRLVLTIFRLSFTLQTRERRRFLLRWVS